MTYIIFTLLHNLLDFCQVNLFKTAKHWDSFFTHYTVCACTQGHCGRKLGALPPMEKPNVWLSGLLRAPSLPFMSDVSPENQWRRVFQDGSHRREIQDQPTQGSISRRNEKEAKA